MDLGGEFCLVCGAEPPLFSGRMCEKCTRDRVTLVKVPKNVPWTRCARCGIIEFQGKWSNVDPEDLWYELVQRNAMKVWEFGKDFKLLLKSDKDISELLTEDEIDELFDLNKILININKVYKRLELEI